MSTARHFESEKFVLRRPSPVPMRTQHTLDPYRALGTVQLTVERSPVIRSVGFRSLRCSQALRCETSISSDRCLVSPVVGPQSGENSPEAIVDTGSQTLLAHVDYLKNETFFSKCLHFFNTKKNSKLINMKSYQYSTRNPSRLVVCCLQNSRAIGRKQCIATAGLEGFPRDWQGLRVVVRDVVAGSDVSLHAVSAPHSDLNS